MQCAAVRTHSLLIRLAPHSSSCGLRLYSITCLRKASSLLHPCITRQLPRDVVAKVTRFNCSYQGAEATSASSPPTMRFSRYDSNNSSSLASFLFICSNRGRRPHSDAHKPVTQSIFHSTSWTTDQTISCPLVLKIIINSISIILETANQFNHLNLLKYLQPLHFGKPRVAKAIGYI